jgi:hypothetical protein
VVLSDGSHCPPANMISDRENQFTTPKIIKNGSGKQPPRVQKVFPGRERENG